MKSPIPTPKPKSYYSSPFKPKVVRDEITPQLDPVINIEEPIIIEEPAAIEKSIEEIPKIKKPKSTDSKS